jgi:uncharacterized protein YbaR (Trm112 family)
VEAEELACPSCRARPLVEIQGAGEKFEGAYAVEARVHTIEGSGYRVLFVYCPHCRTVLGVVPAD